ncbi:MAG: transcription termination/antitermination protein NusG [Alloprevotella sp.]|nr:transcription termination/antitermination protein NusG [Alloprevotella sp.]
MATEMQWYVLRAVSGQEAKVKEYLDAEIKNQTLKHVGQVLIPTEKFVTMRGTKRVVKERPYLPGYVLVEAALVGETAHHLRFTPNVLGFLGGLDNPTPMRRDEINRILGKQDEVNSEVADFVVPFTEGEAVKVCDGPFSGFTGTVEKVNNERKSLTVTVLVFGRSTPLDLNYTQVEKE